MRAFLGDVRIGVRQFARRPGFTAAAILTLALGVGLNTTLFSVVHALLFKQAAIADPAGLVEVYSSAGPDIPQFTSSYPDYLAVREHVSAFSDIAGHAFVRGIVSTGARPALVTGEAVTERYFEVLGVSLAQGRRFDAADHAGPGAPAVMVMSHGMWQRRFGGGADVLGSAVRLSGVPYTVVGIAPAAFTGTMPGLAPEFWVPAVHIDRLSISGPIATAGPQGDDARIERRGLRWLFLKARLAEGRTVADAQAQLETLFARLRQDHPVTNENVTPSVVELASVRFHPMLDGYVRLAGAGLMIAVGLVLVVACANVAGMLLARGTARRRELAIRAAIGAGRGRLVRQLLTESFVLAAAGGTLGTLVAWWSGRLLTGLGADALPMGIAFDVGVDRTVLLFSLAATAVVALAAGLAPAWSAATPDLVPALKDDGRGADGRRRVTMRDALVVGQLAVSLVLLVAGALLGRGLLVARNTETGYDDAQVALLSFNLQMNGYDVDRAVAFRERAAEALTALPGVTAVSSASRLPLAPDITMEAIRVPGHHAAADPPTPVDAASIGADYFTVMGLQLVEGRSFSRADEAEARRVVIVNETMARQFWPGTSAVGQRIYPDGFDNPPVEVIGVAPDHKVRSMGEAPRPYMLTTPDRTTAVSLVVRTSGPAEAALPVLRQAIWALEPDVVFTEDVAGTAVAEVTMAPTRIAAGLIGAFGLLALTLAAVGLYGVIAYAVSLRTREMGIRLALGAPRGRVLWMVLGQGTRLAAIGMLVGTAAAMVAGQALEALLYGVSTFDPIAYTGAAGALLLVAVLANLVPAIHAARINPVQALRNE